MQQVFSLSLMGLLYCRNLHWYEFVQITKSCSRNLKKNRQYLFRIEMLYSQCSVSLVGNCRTRDLADFSFRSRSLQNHKFTLMDWPAFREVMKVAREYHFGNLGNNRPLNDFIVRRSPLPNVCRQTS